MNNMSQIMKQAKAMQEKMAEMQKKIEQTEVEGTSGGGAVKVLINGKHEVKKINIDKSLIDPNESEVLEDLIVAAMHEAKKNADNLSEQEMKSVTGGMPMPPGIKF